MKTNKDLKTYGIFFTPANRKIIEKLEAKNATIIKFPPLETEIIEKSANIEFIKENLDVFEWIIFPDIFAVDYFLELLEAIEFDLFDLDDKKILALGEAVSDRLRFSQIHSDLIPDSVEAEKIFAAVENYLQIDEIEQIKFLLPKMKGREIEFNNYLLKNKADVTELEIYSADFPNQTETGKLKALLSGGAIDNFIFSAPEDVFYLSHLLFPKTIYETLKDVEIKGSNEITMQTLRENGLNSMYF